MTERRSYEQRGVNSASRPMIEAARADLRARILALLVAAGDAGLASEALHEELRGRHPNGGRRTGELERLQRGGFVRSSRPAAFGPGVQWSVTAEGRAEHAANTARRAA